MGIAYRDLKPENILLDSAGHVDVADYGLYEAFLPYEKVNLISILSVGKFTYRNTQAGNVGAV
jgi:serine/threonine protein kinase